MPFSGKRKANEPVLVRVTVISLKAILQNHSSSDGKDASLSKWNFILKDSPTHVIMSPRLPLCVSSRIEYWGHRSGSPHSLILPLWHSPWPWASHACPVLFGRSVVCWHGWKHIMSIEAGKLRRTRPVSLTLIWQWSDEWWLALCRWGKSSKITPWGQTVSWFFIICILSLCEMA